MLLTLHIRDYALISSLDIEFFSGFSVITGETGAGKSIILGALGLLLGQRADARAIKTGARRCVIEAEFDLSDLPVASFFDENDLDYDGRACIVRREVTDAGKSRAFVNDTPVSLALLKELAPYLIDIHSQHQNLLLGESNFQLHVVDTVAGNAAERETYAAAFSALQASRKALRELEERIERERANYDYALYQLNEIEDARLEVGEQEALEQEAKTLENAETIKDELYHLEHLFSAGEPSLCGMLRDASRRLTRLGGVYPAVSELCERIEACSIEVDDIGRDVSGFLEDFSFDPRRLEQINDRLNLIYALQKKHRVDSVEALLQLAETLRAQVSTVENGDERVAELRTECAAGEKRVAECAAALTATRHQAATSLSAQLVERLQPLGMPNVRFEVAVTPLAAPTAMGADSVAFRFSANKSAALQDLSQIASGGEIARVMLSLKAILTERAQYSAIIFDEIDTGVSGRVAEAMAMTMRRMGVAAGRQVISITHLPQIAAMGQHQYRVYKSDEAEATETHIVCLSPEERVTEIAHLLSGNVLTEAALNNAKELLQQAEQLPAASQQ